MFIYCSFNYKLYVIICHFQSTIFSYVNDFSFYLQLLPLYSCSVISLDANNIDTVLGKNVIDGIIKIT